MPARRRAHPPRLYPQNDTPRLSPRLFRSPTSEYRGAPFWSWNTRLDERRLLEQFDKLGAMGFGGAHVHARTGLETDYLGPDFTRAVLRCVAHARRRRMRVWLYDEDRWPSGFAGGEVSRDPAFRERTLRWTTRADPPGEGAVLLGRYEVRLRGGRLEKYRSLPAGAAPRVEGSTVWHAWLETAGADSWFNGQSYIDTFNPAAVERFVRVTHERYRAAVGRHFGSTIPAIFTDEPHFRKKQHFKAADAVGEEVILPFSPDFFDTYASVYGHRLERRLPELFWNLPDDAPSQARYCYHDHTAERFAAAFGDTIARWCGRHGLRLTGHMLSEATLFGQTRAVGEVMRGLRAFQIPGVDVLEDKDEYTTVKQAQSVARQLGREAVTSELYGVTGWDFDFAGHKRQGDWQAALGVTVRVPHLAWASMAGESKRDYPAAIDYHSPWYREYPVVEDHFARLNTVLSRGRPVVRVAVIHPIESFWLAWGPANQCAGEWAAREAAFKNLTEWLLFGLVDFDFVSEAVLAPLPAQRGRGFAVGKMRYDAVIVPGLRTIRRTTLDRLRAFAASGGTVIFAGDAPTLLDARSSGEPGRLTRRCATVEWSRKAILGALRPFRDVAAALPDGTPPDALLYQLRQDGDRRHLFVCNTSRAAPVEAVELRLDGAWDATRLDTATGRNGPIAAEVVGGATLLRHSFAAHDHLLVSLDPAGGRRRRSCRIAAKPAPRWAEACRIAGPVPVTLSEPNVLLLDQAEWKVGDGPWRGREEILRIDNAVRREFGLPERGGRMAQPWTDRAPAPVLANVRLRFEIEAARAVRSPSLALEGADRTTIELNGRTVKRRPAGWWVDESIRTVRLPSLRAGTNVLVLTIAFARKTGLEWAYLLGDFSVALDGRRARLGRPVRRLDFGDWTRQGLPFYAGNVTYHCGIRGDGREMLLEAADFRNPLLTVALDGRRVGPIAFAPYRLPLGVLRGRHRLDITAFGNRHNAFGPLHHTKRDLTWVGPAAWRSTGEWWSYDHHLKPTGLLSAPAIHVRQED